MRRKHLLVPAILLAFVLLAGEAAADEPDPDRSAAEARESGPEAPPDGGIIAVGARLNSGAGVVRLYTDRDDNNTYETKIDEFRPYTSNPVGGIRVAMGDFDGDGNAELVTATGGNTPIKIYDMSSDGHHGAQLLSFTGFPNGAYVATGDFNGDGLDELVTSADHGSSTVQIRGDSTGSGLPSTVTNTFSAYGTNKGVRVAVGNLNSDTGDDLATASGPGATSPVLLWNDVDEDRQVSDDGTFDSFLPFDPAFNKGTQIAVGPDTAGGTDTIVVGPESGAKRVRRFDDTDLDNLFSDQGAVEQFFAYGSGFAGGVRVALGDVDNSGTFNELIVAPGTQAGSHQIRTIDDTGLAPNLFSLGTTIQNINACAGCTGGEFVAFGKQFTDAYAVVNPTSIPDSATSVARIRVPSDAGVIRGMNTFLGIIHTFDADLDITLTHVNTGTSVTLMTDVGGSADGFLVTLQDGFGDIGAVAGVDGQTVKGFFAPEAPALLSVFNGQDASGTWTLSITDDAGGDVGVLMAWELRFFV